MYEPSEETRPKTWSIKRGAHLYSPSVRCSLCFQPHLLLCLRDMKGRQGFPAYMTIVFFLELLQKKLWFVWDEEGTGAERGAATASCRPQAKPRAKADLVRATHVFSTLLFRLTQQGACSQDVPALLSSFAVSTDKHDSWGGLSSCSTGNGDFCSAVLGWGGKLVQGK